MPNEKQSDGGRGKVSQIFEKPEGEKTGIFPGKAMPINEFQIPSQEVQGGQGDQANQPPTEQGAQNNQSAEKED